MALPLIVPPPTGDPDRTPAATPTHAPDTPRALFLGSDGQLYPDTLICSGLLPAELAGQPCPYADAGHCPLPLPLDAADSRYTIDKGPPGDYCPPCAKQQLGPLGHWQRHGGQQFPAELDGLRLFKCRQWLWLVVPGLADRDARPAAPPQS